MPFVAASKAMAHVAKFLPAIALDIYCKAASDAEQAGQAHNDCVKAGWTAVSGAGWRKPVTGKKYIKDDTAGGDGPIGGSIHVDSVIGSKKPPKKKPPVEEEDETMKFETSGDIIKVDESLGLVFGFAIVCKKDGEDYFDVQGDHIPEDAMLKAATDFMQHSRVAKEMHTGDQHGEVVFAWPMTEDIAKSLGITSETTGLMIAMKPSADVLEKYKSGEYTGFSIGGSRGDDEEVD